MADAIRFIAFLLGTAFGKGLFNRSFSVRRTRMRLDHSKEKPVRLFLPDWFNRNLTYMEKYKQSIPELFGLSCFCFGGRFTLRCSRCLDRKSPIAEPLHVLAVYPREDISAGANDIRRIGHNQIALAVGGFHQPLVLFRLLVLRFCGDQLGALDSPAKIFEQ